MIRRAFTKTLLSAVVVAVTASAALAAPSAAPRDKIAPSQPVEKVCSGR